MDSACTSHMTRDKSLFVYPNLTASSQKYVTFGDNNKGKVIGLGKVAISKDKSSDDVLLFQYLGFNLMPVGKLCDLGMLVLFSISKSIVYMASNNSFIFQGIRKGDLTTKKGHIHDILGRTNFFLSCL